MNSKDKRSVTIPDVLTFSRLQEQRTLREAALTGSKIRLTYPSAKRGQKTVYATLEDAAEMPQGRPLRGEKCTCLACVFRHARNGRGRN